MSAHPLPGSALPRAMSGEGDLIGPFHAQPAQQIRVGLMHLRGPAGIGLLVDRHQAHKPHQSTNALVFLGIPLVPKVPCHLLDAVKRCLKELLVDRSAVSIFSVFSMQSVCFSAS